MTDPDWDDLMIDRLYDRQGKPIRYSEYVSLKYRSEDYLRIGLDEFGDGWTVSTVWLGIDHSYLRQGPPIIFETMTFGGPMDSEVHGRYATERSARIGHRIIATMYRRKWHGWVKHQRDERRQLTKMWLATS